MKLMQPITTHNIESNSEFLYEIKYDGFRAALVWEMDTIKLISRNRTNLTKNFPEITSFCKHIQPKIEHLLPITLDGELVVLNNKFQANFSAIQQRGRLKTNEKIEYLAKKRPASFIAFDILQIQGQELQGFSLQERKKKLHTYFDELNNLTTDVLQTIDIFDHYVDASRAVFEHKGEGIVAKRKDSLYTPGKGHSDWLKEKNWRTIYAFLTEFNQENGYFKVNVYHNEAIFSVGHCKHGNDGEAVSSLKTIFTTNGERRGSIFQLPPAICAAIHTLDLHGNELREPEFKAILPELTPEECTTHQLKLDLAMLPSIVETSNEDKVFWPELQLTKGDLLAYMREVYPYMIPYIENRALTVIRCPDGIDEESFFQKNLPSYAPDYVLLIEEEDRRIQLCNNIESLIWYANHSAIEYHIPFQSVSSHYPNEIVFDLDPPDLDHFQLAVKAALIIKQLLDQLELEAFIKTSGKTGLQIHIPIPPETISYDDISIFTEAISKTVENSAPTLFTTERFKKNRGNRLYIDYVQFGKNKTIVAPYSPRMTETASVATPLYWEEVTENLHPDQFTIQNVVERVQTKGCPWLFNYEQAKKQKLDGLIELIKGES